MAEHQFEGAIKGYLVNQMEAQMWRFRSTMTEADVMQEGYEVFLRCAYRYPNVEERHFMALFKTALSRQFTDLAHKDTKARAISLTDDPDGEAITRELVGEMENEGYLRTIIRQAPAEVVQVLTLFLNAPAELVEMAMENWRSAGHKDAGGNKQVALWLGLPPASKPLDKLRDYFTEAL